MLRELQNELIIYWQASGSALRPLMELLSQIGEPLIYAAVIALIYWCFDPRLGRQLIVFTLVSGALNDLLKQIAQQPRPYWDNAGIEPVGEIRTSYGWPSGHAQAATMWLLLADHLRRRWLWWLAIGVVFGIGVSRVMLGKHYPTQVIAGWLIGLTLVYLILRFEAAIAEWFRTRSLTGQLALALLACPAAAAAGGVLILMVNDGSVDTRWLAQVQPRLADNETFSPRQVTVWMVYCGAFSGLLLAQICLLHGAGLPDMSHWARRWLRLPVGVATVAPALIATILGLRAGWFDHDDALIAGMLTMLPVAILMWFAVYLAPAVFRLLRL